MSFKLGLKNIFSCILLCAAYQTLFAGCNVDQQQVIVTIVPDLFPQETSWILRDELTGALVDSGQAVGDTLCIDSGRCLSFTIFDSFGDGLCCSNGTGSYNITLNGIVVANGGQFAFYETTIFNCPPGIDCNNSLIASLDTMTALRPETWYLFVPDSTGLYEISTCNLGNTCDPVIYVYDHCTHLLLDTTNEGTSFYNAGGCNSNQAFVSAALSAGLPYYIRIGQQDTSCIGHNIHWQIRFVGPIMGCMDSTSCNFNPLATVPDTTCIYAPNPHCPLPDLAIDEGVFRSSLYLSSIAVENTDCYVPDGCLSAYGTRLLIRFATVIKNIGNEDFYLGMPDSSNPSFVYDLCHQHWHYIGYAEYLLIGQNGEQAQIGFKDGFCVEDLSCDSGVIGKFGCIRMGLTAGCSDGYAAYLDCQWIDITDVDTGNYTLLLGVNWLNRPDALGHSEIAYSNNWAQACVHIFYDSLGNKKFNQLSDCPRYVDCAGDTFGSARKDCNGICNGPTLMGDLNLSQVRDSTDLLLYLEGITSESLSMSQCDDLNGDGRITVGDAARMNGCLRYQDGTITNYINAQTGQHLCEFPYRLTDFLDTVTFDILDINWSSHYVDLSVKNPSCKVMGYELKLHGVTIDSISSMMAGNYHPDIRYSTSGHITELSDEDSGISKQLTPVNFLRIYFSSVSDSNICIEKIIDVVNTDIEQVLGIMGNSCQGQPTADDHVKQDTRLKIIPNPTTGKVTIKNSGQSITSVILIDQLGQKVAAFYSLPPVNPVIDISPFPIGVYYLVVQCGEGKEVYKVIKK